MMGRGVTFVDFIKEVPPRPACKQHPRDLRQETADARGALGVTPKVFTPFRDAAGLNPAPRSPELRTIYPIEGVCGGRSAPINAPPDAQRKLTTTNTRLAARTRA